MATPDGLPNKANIMNPLEVKALFKPWVIAVVICAILAICFLLFSRTAENDVPPSTPPPAQVEPARGDT